MKEFSAEARKVLQENILPFWLKLRDPNGGFYGRVDGNGVLDPTAPRGIILNARILWAFSAAYRALCNPEYLSAATHAWKWFKEAAIDHVYGGVFWSVTAQGEPLDVKKQLYSQAFAIYGLSEYVRATGDSEALLDAVKIFRLIESHYRDAVHGGYTEALSREFLPLEDMSLSAHDINADKTMNSHLHLLEAYANLYKVWPDESLKEAVHSLLQLHKDVICGPSGHLHLYFKNDWSVLPGAVSYGHDIETSWLILECAEAIGETESCSATAARLAAAGNEGLLEDGSMMYELLPDGQKDTSRQWWVQAEALVGNLWRWSAGDPEGLERARKLWSYIT